METLQILQVGLRMAPGTIEMAYSGTGAWKCDLERRFMISFAC